MSETLSRVSVDSPEVQLRIDKNSDCDFDVKWYQSDGETLVPMDSIEGWVAEKYDSVDLVADLSTGTGYATIVNGVAQVRIPGADTADMDYLERGVWEIIGIAALSGQRKKLAGGPAIVREDV